MKIRFNKYDQQPLLKGSTNSTRKEKRIGARVALKKKKNLLYFGSRIFANEKKKEM